MSDLEDFVKKVIIEKKDNGELEQLQQILALLDEKPKIVYRTYNTTINA